MKSRIGATDMTKSKRHALGRAAAIKAEASLTRQVRALANAFAGSKEKGARLIVALEAGRTSKTLMAFAGIAFPLLEAREMLR
jgi:hypothetical protein